MSLSEDLKQQLNYVMIFRQNSQKIKLFAEIKDILEQNQKIMIQQ